MPTKDIITLALSLVAVSSAFVVAFSRNLVHSAFALLGVFAAVAGLYILLSADFVAIIQLVVYIGGILVLILFAVFLTSKIGDVKISNRPMSSGAAALICLTLGAVIWTTFAKGAWKADHYAGYISTTKAIGQKLLQEYLVPFEIISFILVVVMVGAVVLARREVK